MAEIALLKTTAEQQLAAQWLEAGHLRPGLEPTGLEPTSLGALRAAAFDRFQNSGLPNRRVEAWKYTDLRALMRDAKPLAAPPDAAAKARASHAGASLASIEARRIVFVDGAFAPELSDLADLEPGFSIRSMADVLVSGDQDLMAQIGQVVPTEDIAVALNTAFMADGAVIRVGPGATLSRPLHLIFFNSAARPAAVFARSFVVMEKAARAMLIESHEGAAGADCQVNAMLEIRIADGAHVDHIKITGAGSGALHLSSLMVSVGAHARFNEFLFTCGAQVVRNQVFVRITGEQAIVALRGASLLSGHQHTDTTLIVDHVASNCTSREVFKTVLDDESRGVFQGKIVVRPYAQKTDGRMASHGLLLSENAEAYNKPELEIFADDVQCGHGATAGALDENLLFYLKARGIPAKEAESLLIQAFVGDAVEGIEHAGLRDELMAHVAGWLAARQGGAITRARTAS
jgi:Fe-S cluster assembly protein SufD